MRPVAGLSIHIVVYAVVNAVLVGIWLFLGGTTDDLRAVADDPIQAIRDGFWPGWVIAAWAPGLVLHLGIWLSLALFGGRARRRRRELARKAFELHQRKHHGTPEPQTTATAAPGRRWVAAMFTDIAGSTALAETLGDESWHEILAEHRELVRGLVTESEGTEVGTQGDGFLVQFDSPTTAVQCAMAVQRRLDASRESGAFVPHVRIGIHAGEAMHGDGDLVGRVVNLAARVMASAEPDEILVTEPVADHVPASVPLVDRGLRPLRGVSQPRHLLAVAWERGAGDRSGAGDPARTVVLDDVGRPAGE